MITPNISSLTRKVATAFSCLLLSLFAAVAPLQAQTQPAYAIILPGTTGQATFIDEVDRTVRANWNLTPTAHVAAGYIDDVDGNATLPASAPAGDYTSHWSYNFQPAVDGYQAYKMKTFRFTVVKLEMVNPSGDPTKATEQQQGNTANNYVGNEFTFDNSAAGVCTIRCEAQIAPNNATMQAWAEQNVEWTVPDIGTSTKTWVNADGTAADNKGLVVYCRFTNLPANNNEFGLKEVKMTALGVDTKRNIEVFYTATATNHPGQSVTKPTPNWFHYYKQNEGGTDYGFDPSETSHTIPGQPGSTTIGLSGYASNEYMVTQVINNQLTVTGWSPTIKYYAAFIGAVAHEREHAQNAVPITNPSDTDHDNLTSLYEAAITETDPNDPFSAQGTLANDDQTIDRFNDGEVYAGGTIEGAAVQGAVTSQDWAFPGSNSASAP